MKTLHDLSAIYEATNLESINMEYGIGKIDAKSLGTALASMPNLTQIKISLYSSRLENTIKKILIKEGKADFILND